MADVFCAHTKMVDIEKVIPNPRNPNKHSEKQIVLLAKIIAAQGWRAPITVSTRSGFIVRGHGRLLAARKLGLANVPVDLQDYENEAAEWADLIADNRLSELSEIDELLLKDLLQDLNTGDMDFELTAYTVDEIEQMLQVEQEVEEDDFDADKALAEIDEPTTKPGDIYQLGKHRLICGDSTDAAVYQKLMAGQKANLVVTDPPYNVNYSAQAGNIKNDNLKDEEFYNFLFKAFSNMASSMELDASIYVFHADTEGYNFRKAFKDAGLYLSGVCIWAKQSLVLGRSPYQWRHEPVLFGWRKDGKHKWYADRKQSTIWNFDRPAKNGLHPTMKPVALCAYPIQNSSISNCIVLDPFGGSGSILIACEKTGRICHTIELDEKYTDVIVKRYIELIGTDNGVFLERDGQKIAYKDVTKSQ